MTLGPLFVGSALPGYIVGSASLGSTGLVLSVGGLLGGSAAVFLQRVQSSVSSGCPTCVDALIIAPFVILLVVIPFAGGYLLGRRVQRRRASKSNRAAPEPVPIGR